MRCIYQTIVELLEVKPFGKLRLWGNDVELHVSEFIWTIFIIVNDDQQDATILAYLFIPNQLYLFRGMSSPIIRSCKYSQVLLMMGEYIARNK